MSSTQTSSDHYQAIGADFEQRWFFTADYVSDIATHMAKHLQLTASDRLLDLGGGTGLYLHHILDAAPFSLNQPALCVDSCPELLQQAAKRRAINTECNDIVSFLDTTAHTWDKIILKEVIHHLPYQNTLFQHIRRILSAQGRALIVTRPQEVEFPFFEAALRQFAAGQPSVDALSQSITQAGLHAKCDTLRYPLALPREQICQMMAQRFMSIFAHFTDEALHHGIAEVQARYHQHPVVHFDDVLIFITITPH